MKLLRYGLISCGLILPGAAWAQYAPFQPPGGLAPATVVGHQTLAQMQALTAAAIPASQKGVAGGVAALDGGGAVAAPLVGDATHAAVTPAGGAATTLGAYLGTLATSSDLSAYLTARAASEAYATLSALGETDSVAHAAQETAQAAVPSATLLDASGRMKLAVSGDTTGASVVPGSGSSVTLGTYLGGLATLAGLSAETGRATGAEATLQGNITAEAATRADADSAISVKIGGYSSFIYATGNIALSADDAGGLVELYGPGGVVTTLPSAATIRAGQVVTFYASATASSYTISTYGTETIWDGATTRSSISVLSGSVLILMSRGYGQWDLIHYYSGQNSFTVSQLPTSGIVAGTHAYVSDAASPDFLGVVTGGGATVCPVFFNGTIWVVG